LPSLAERIRDALAREAAPRHGGDADVGAAGGAAPGPRPEALVPAAVLMAVTDRAEPGLILTRRTETLRTHAGQIAFPGGRIDPGDAGPVAAALREAEEEIALPRGEVRVLGVADPWHTTTGFRVAPVVGLVPPGLPLQPCAREVAELFEVPLAHVLDPRHHQLREAEWQGVRRRFYVIEWQGRAIWGATAGMLVNLAGRLG
jgi:8-oxo-dGTP pyrophosphatase MutT (NUDIX family)